MIRTTLDDIDISDIEGYQAEEDEARSEDYGIDLHDISPLEAKEADTSTGEYADSTHAYGNLLGRRLRTKTKPLDAPLKYRNFHNLKKKPIDYSHIKKAVKVTKHELQSKFDMRSAILSSRHIDSQIKLVVQGGSAGAMSRIHSAHMRMLVNQFIFCRHCGLYALHKVEGLSKPCIGKPTNSLGQAQRKRLLEGRCPVRGATEWPDGTHIRVQYKPISFGLLLIAL